jgi:hypothetical protein
MKPVHNPFHTARHAHSAVRGQRGVSIVEFLIVAPIAILLILGLIQIGLMMVAKQIVNEAAFEGARLGASEHGKKDAVVRAVKRKLLPFYQDSTNYENLSDTQRAARLVAAAAAEMAAIDLSFPPVLTVTRLSPPESAFQPYPTGYLSSVYDDNGNPVMGIPNDNLEYRTYSANNSGLSIQDANVFRIKVVYGYKLKVPLMQTVFKAVLCGIDSGVDAFGRGNFDSTVIKENANGDCLLYYDQGRVPITAFATVHMQSDAWKNSGWN